LWEPVASLTDFEIYPTVTIAAFEVVFIDELVWYVRQLDADIFWIFHGSV
jgi:hypothetical protein